MFRNTIRGYDLGIHVSAGTGFELSENSIDDTGMAIELGLTGTLTSAPLTQYRIELFSASGGQTIMSVLW